MMMNYTFLPLDFGLGYMSCFGQWDLSDSEQRLKHSLVFGFALWHRPSEQSQA